MFKQWRDTLASWKSKGHRKHKETPSERHARQAPQSLPYPRPRALTLLENPALLPPIGAQTNSNLLLRLPYEVRRQIYVEVLGDHLLHIVRMHGRLAHVKCMVPHAGGTNTRRHECWGYMDKDLIYRRGRPSDEGLLGLLKTCRQAYVSILVSIDLSKDLLTKIMVDIPKPLTSYIRIISST